MCEAILFRLAQHYETEPSIGNNGTAIWQNLFKAILAGTKVPFPERLPLLLRRLREATAEQQPLVLGAAMAAVESHYSGLPMPPRAGGRVVPPPWQPATFQELEELRRNAGRQIVDVIAAFPPERSLPALQAVDSLHVFIWLRLVPQFGRRSSRLGRWSSCAALRRASRKFHHTPGQQQCGRKWRALREWLKELSPQDLAGRIRNLTSQGHGAPGRQEGREATFASHADER